MALRDEIKAIVESLSTTPAFVFGTENEANTKVDDVDTSKGVVFMFALQPVQNVFTNQKTISNNFSLYMQFLFKVDFDTYTEECEPYDKAAILMLNEFLIKLANYRSPQTRGKIFKINNGDISNSNQVFNKWDVNMVGRDLKINKLQTFYDDKICY